MIKMIHDPSEKRRVARLILEALPDWFGVQASIERYVADSALQPCFAAEEDGRTVGVLLLKRTGANTAEIAVMGVLPEYHRGGIGRKLFEAARAYAVEAGYSFLQVKTVRMGMYPDYDRTNRFYLAMGFKEFEVIPELWDAQNPCQIYVMYLN